MHMMLTGKEIRELREALDESLKVFGVRFGVHESTVSRWESDESLPRRRHLAELAKLWKSKFPKALAAAK